VQAKADAKAAEERVARLEQEMADLKAGKAAGEPGQADPSTVEKVKADHLKALDSQLAQARQKVGEKRKEAAALAAMPKAQAPRVTVVEVPAKTQLSVKLARDLATDKVQAGDTWEGSLTEPVAVGGRQVWPAGTPVKGVVSQSSAPGRLSAGQGGLGIRLTEVGRQEVEAGTFLVVGDKRGQRNAKYIGGAAALGALIGILSDSKHQGDHALGGAAAGAAAGTALAAGTADTVIRIPAARPVTFSLTVPRRVAVP
jgi:hypothetical protein